MSEAKKEIEAPEFEDGYPAMRYRPSNHPRGFEHVIVRSSAEEKALKGDWYKNPGHFGVSINGGKIPDSEIIVGKRPPVSVAPSEETPEAQVPPVKSRKGAKPKDATDSEPRGAE